MAELDLLNYPGSKLGSITSPAPSVFKPETKQTPLGPEPEPSASDGYLKAVEPFQKKYEEAIKAETELTSAQKEQELRSEAIRQKSNADALRAETETIKNNDVLKQRNEIDGKLIDAAFVPRQDNAQDLATLFSLINVVGVAIGSGGKGNAMQAMSAMNGMAEGYQKGRADLYKKEKDQFDINIKALKNKSEILSKRLAEIAVLASKDKEAARIEADVLFNEQGADFYKQHAKQFGIASTAKIAKENFNAASKAYELGLQQHQKQEDAKRADQRHKEDLQSRERLRLATLTAQQGRRDEQALRSVGPALRNIAEQYPEGTVNTLLGASPDDKKKVQGAYRAVEESESAADYIARNPGAVGALAVVRNFLKMDAIASLQNPDEAQAAQQKSLLVDNAIDKGVQEGKIRSDDAQSAKVLQKKLFGLALSDVQGSGQRGSVYLDKSFQNLYDQASRQDTLLKIIKERSQDNNRNLKTYKLNIERHNNPEQFPLLETDSVEKFIKDRTPKSNVPPDVETKLKGKPEGTGARANGKIYRIYGGVVQESAE